MGEPSHTDHFTHQVDDFYFSALFDAKELFPISDEKYANELLLQEVLMSSTIAATSHRRKPPPSQSQTKPTTRRKKERGESSTTRPETFCKICMEAAPTSEMFLNTNCSHAFCRHCLSQSIGAKVQENISTVKCPEMDCKGVLEPEFCQEIIPREVFERWGSALCESMVLGSQRFNYCPFKDCSALLVDDGEGKKVTQSECPSCRRLFCAKCEVSWHSGVSCEEFRRLGVDERGREDLILMEVVKNKRWKRCPNCKFFVEKITGCLHITCRCGFEFCYGCGSKWSITHASCRT